MIMTQQPEPLIPQQINLDISMTTLNAAATNQQQKQQVISSGYGLSTDPSDKTMTVVFVLGGPGSGKGTQCDYLEREFGFVHVCAGDLLREERGRPGSEFGDLIDTCLKEGRIVPREITVSLLRKVIHGSATKKFLIDGFPRELDQAELFERQLGHPSFILFFDCSESAMEQRLLQRSETSGRIDDNPESIRKRFNTFQKLTMPVIRHYESLGKVCRIDATCSITDVSDSVRKLFSKLNSIHHPL